MTETPQEVDETYKLVLQVVNVLGYTFMMTSLVLYILDLQIATLYELVIGRADGLYGERYDSTVDPSGYVFGIWPVIYTGWAFFIAYQALPSEWVPSRNDKLIFNDIGYMMVANMVSFAAFTIFWSFANSLFYHIGSLCSIISMLATALYILYQSSKNEVDWIELVVLRGTFSLYAGWLSAATILVAKAFL